MKRLMFLLALIIGGVNFANGQIYVDGQKIKVEALNYIEVEFFNVVGSNEVKAFIDYGQSISFLERKKRLISDRKGKAMVYNSKVQGLNWLYANGWEVTEVYNPRTGGDAVNNDLIYLLKRVRGDNSTIEE